MKKFNITEFFEEYSRGLDEFPIIYSKDDLEKTILSSSKPRSLFSLVSFLPKINSLRIGVFDLYCIEEFYSIGILYRSCIEHSVKAMYIWMKMISDSSDDIGKDYLGMEGDLEKIRYAASLNKQIKVQGGSPIPNIFAFMQRMELVSNGSSRREVERETNSFKIYKMLDWMLEEKSRSVSAPSLLLEVYPLYEELTSIVHAMPNSTSSYELIGEQSDKILKITAMLSLSLYVLIYRSLAQENPMYEDVAEYCELKIISFTKELNE
ncbi:hypothetical protein SAMN03080615_03664 [Amphritea atlantica]|uniref:Uncharacterized protein n=1 Tax=Amphritea atlantica TaxID=355243 RepID=A0A1H9KUH7_9GAMM|nr:hypothetical protein [Amphritea atlantica]SER02679.1 hypothetical protein SAMN03080615_03664 [Amphritea atlantica]